MYGKAPVSCNARYLIVNKMDTVCRKKEILFFSEKNGVCTDRICTLVQDQLGTREKPSFFADWCELLHYACEEGLLSLENQGRVSASPPGYYKGFADFHSLFRDEFRELWALLHQDAPFRVYRVRLGMQTQHQKTDAGYIWGVQSELYTGESFFAVLYRLVNPPFRRAGVSNILKQTEICFAKWMGARFIHTFHESANPHFLSLVIPGLKQDFFFYKGTDAGNEVYEESGFVHLRKYLFCHPGICATVHFQNSKTYTSPMENPLIIRELIRWGTDAGKAIARIDPFEMEYSGSEVL